MSSLKLIVNQDLTRLGASIQKHEKEGIEIEKGAILTEEYLIRHEDLFKKYCEFFSAYPDLFIDLITPSDSNFSLFFYQRIFLRACLRYRYHYCTACLTKGTPVLTEYGMMPIEQVSGDIRVWTKDGWQYPLNLNIREWNGDFISIEGENCFEQKITTTNDHKFLAVHRDKNTTRAGTFWKEGLEFFNITNYEQRKEFYRKNLRKLEKVEWIRADQLTENDFLLSPIDIEVRNLKEIKAPTPTYQMKNLIKDKILIDNNFCEWMGIWLAEGSWNRNQISFTISIKEESLKKRILFLAKEVFGLDGSVIERDNNSQAIYFNSAHLRLFFEKIFNCKYNEINQWNKWIPTCLLYIDPKIQLQIVKGWLSGDGYYRKNRNCYRYKGTTVSNVLVEGMKHILYRNFVNPSITIEDREGKAKVYNLNFNGLLAKEFKEAIDENRIVLIKENMRLGEYYPYLIDNKLYMINKVRKISFSRRNDSLVYCLEMPNESFNVNGVEGHNCRAFSKTFISILALYLECMFMPGTKRFICAPGKNQSAKIAKDKIYEIWDKLPLLKKEIIGDGNFGKDYVTLMFRNGSIFDVVGALDTERGGRRHGGLIDEIRDHDGEILNAVVLPLMNVSRRTPRGEVNINEPNQQQLYMTSAGVKSSYAYERLIDLFEMSIINPKQAFVWGCDYRIPVLHGLLDKQYINELKMSPSYNEETFAREYLSVWSGGSEESWFNFDKLQKYRKIKNPETHAIIRPGTNSFYLLSVDVGRISDQTVCCVFRVNILNGKYYATLVNLFVLGRQAETKTFYQQAIDLKKIIQDFNPKEVVIDTNGLGVGLGDEMIRTQYDELGNLLPAYGFINDDNYKKVQPKDAICILYGIKANGPLNSKIHGNAYSRLSSGMVRFLIKEQEAKSALMSTKVGQKMSTIQRVKRIMPHEMTTKLFEEMANLRLKRTGATLDIVLEQINARFPKDKYSAFAYGLWRIKELEEANYKKHRRRAGTNRRLVFFTGG